MNPHSYSVSLDLQNKYTQHSIYDHLCIIYRAERLIAGPRMLQSSNACEGRASEKSYATLLPCCMQVEFPSKMKVPGGQAAQSCRASKGALLRSLSPQKPIRCQVCCNRKGNYYGFGLLSFPTTRTRTATTCTGTATTRTGASCAIILPSLLSSGAIIEFTWREMFSPEEHSEFSFDKDI